MAKKVLTDLNLSQNEIQNAVVQNLASAPNNPKAGQEYFNTTDHKKYIYDGTDWVDETNQGKIYTFSTGLTENAGTVTLNQATTSALGGVIVGSHLSVSSGTISVDEASTTQKGVIEIATDTEASTGTSTTLAVTPKQLATKVTANEAITAGTGTKITYDAKGLVTSSTTLSASDIPSLTLSKISDVTATAAEVNVLDGITATTTELNYVDGVTSSIQTQLNGKVSANAAITAGTATKITYDAKGLVTAGTTLSASDIPDLSSTYVTQSSVGVANGIASLDSDGKVPSSQLPSYVDDIIEAYIVSGATALSAGWLSKTDGGAALTPETGVIYVVMSTGEYQNRTFRWGGTTYVEISSAPGQATESTAGIAAIATQTECTTGTNDTKIVTPLKMATYTSGMAKKSTYTNSALTPSSGVCTWTFSDSKAPNCICSIRETSGGAEVLCDVVYGSGAITIKINSTSNIASGTYTATVIG